MMFLHGALESRKIQTYFEGLKSISVYDLKNQSRN